MIEQDYKTIAYSRLTDRHRNDGAFLAILDTLIELKEIRQREYLKITDEFLDIDKSTGKNLDLIGRLIGEERTLVNFIDRSYFGFLGARLSESYDIGYWYSLYKNKYGTLRTLTDEEYRRVLKARIVKNSSDNNRNSFIEVLNILSGNTNSSVTESYDNTAITVNVEDVDGLVSYYLSKYKSDRNLIPIPLGRRLNVNHVTPSSGGGGNGGDNGGNNGGGGEIPPNEAHFTTLSGSVDYVGTQGDQILLSDGTIVDVTVTDETVTFDVPSGKHKVKLVEAVDRNNLVSVGGEALVELHNFPTLSSVNIFNAYLSPNLVKVPTVLPSNIIDLAAMFYGATSFNQDINMWDTSNVVNMFDMFNGASAFNQPLGNWNTSNVANMNAMFYNAVAFNQDISMWDVSSVTDMDYMFRDASAFNQDLSQWCVPNLESLPYEFDVGATNWTLPRPVWGTCPD